MHDVAERVNFCKDCAYFVHDEMPIGPYDSGWDYRTCFHPTIITVDYEMGGCFGKPALEVRRKRANCDLFVQRETIWSRIRAMFRYVLRYIFTNDK